MWSHESGNLKATGSYRAGKPNGQWAWFQNDGTLTRSKFYVQKDSDSQPAGPEGGEGILAAKTSETDTTASTVMPPVSKSEDSVQAASHNEPVGERSDARDHKNQQIRPAKKLR